MLYDNFQAFNNINLKMYLCQLIVIYKYLTCILFFVYYSLYFNELNSIIETYFSDI